MWRPSLETEMAIICNDTLNIKSNIFVVVTFVLVVDVAAIVVVAADVVLNLNELNLILAFSLTNWGHKTEHTNRSTNYLSNLLSMQEEVCKIWEPIILLEIV